MYAYDSSRAPMRQTRPLPIQARLAVTAPGDFHEREAERLSDQVMRMPAAPHRMNCPCGGGCARCRRDESAAAPRPAPISRSGSGPVQELAAPAIVHDVLSSPGHPLDPSTRGFMEERFGHDFGDVRVHTDARAAESAEALGAAAYTVRRDVVFGPGQYQPLTSDGRRLLAHELTHTIQQGSAPRRPDVSPGGGHVDATPAGAPVIARRPGPSHRVGDPQLASELHPTGPSHLFADQVASVYFGTKSHTPDRDDNLVLKALADEYRYTAQRKGRLKGKVIGHADVEFSDEPDNQDLSFQRARWTAAMFKSYMTEATRGSSVDLQFEVEGAGAGYCMGDPDCGRKSSQNALARYRRADVMIFTEKIADTPQPVSCPPASGARVRTIGEYIELIKCAESKTGYSPVQMLAMLRQMYYGEPWSATSQDSNWRFVIPCSPDLGNPRSRLGDTLFEALHNSDTVEGTDLGHVFTGLEAMLCPSSSVTLEKTKYGIGIELRVDLSNESFATWGGDLGATAGAMTACWMMTDDERASKGKRDCHQGSAPQGLTYYFLKLQAPPEDLEGDIAPFVMRAAQRGQCGGSLGRQFSPQSPVSTIFRDYFYNRGTAAQSSGNRYRCFAEMIGATVVNGTITNRPALMAAYEYGVLSFAWAYYVNLKKEIPRSDPTVQMLQRHARGALSLFLDWLQARMRE